MKTILIASILAFVNDPTGAPTCEDELLVCQDELVECQDDQEVAHDVIEAAIAWAESLRDSTGGGGTTGGGTAAPTIGDIVDACRLFGAPDLGKCVETSCSNLPGNCL